MRINQGQRKNQLHTPRTVLVAIGACALAIGCQGPQLDHVDGSSSTFNANRIPTVDREESLAESGSPQKSAASASADSAASVTQAAATKNDGAVVENLNLGHREAALGRIDQAEAYYHRVLEIQPENSIANHRLAVIADKKRDFARAEHYYLTALRQDSGNPDLLGDIGYSYLLQGRREESERYLLAATRLDPSHSKALHNLSLLYAMGRDYDRSFDALRRAVGENEARVKIARLFPNGRPPANDKDEMVASFQPSDVPSAPATDESADAAHPQEQQPPVPESGKDAVANFGPGDAPPSMPPRTQPTRTANGHVADSQINDLFAAIDRETPDEPLVGITTPPSTAPSDALPATAAPPRSPTGTRGAGTSGSDAPELRAAPNADPLGSMPPWPPAGSNFGPRKPPAVFLLDEGDSATKSPHATPTGIVPASVNPESPRASLPEDALSEFEAELVKDKRTAGAGRTQSNGGLAREPLSAQRPQAGPNGSQDQRSMNAEAAPLRIQPRTDPSPLFEPVEGFGPANNVAPADNDHTVIPGWPGAKGTTGASDGDNGDKGPLIRPRSQD